MSQGEVSVNLPHAAEFAPPSSQNLIPPHGSPVFCFFSAPAWPPFAELVLGWRITWQNDLPFGGGEEESLGMLEAVG